MSAAVRLGARLEQEPPREELREALQQVSERRAPAARVRRVAVRLGAPRELPQHDPRVRVRALWLDRLQLGLRLRLGARLRHHLALGAAGRCAALRLPLGLRRQAPHRRGEREHDQPRGGTDLRSGARGAGHGVGMGGGAVRMGGRMQGALQGGV